MASLLDWFRRRHIEVVADHVDQITRLKKLLALTQAELELANAQAAEMRTHRDALARSVAQHLGKHSCPGKRILSLPKLNMDFDANESVALLDVGRHTQVIYMRRIGARHVTPAS